MYLYVSVIVFYVSFLCVIVFLCIMVILCIVIVCVCHCVFVFPVKGASWCVGVGLGPAAAAAPSAGQDHERLRDRGGRRLQRPGGCRALPRTAAAL